MVESNRADSDGVDADLTLRAIAKYAYAQKSIIGTDYAMMVVMTEYVMAYSIEFFNVSSIVSQTFHHS